MALAEEFDMQWKSVIAFLESEMITQLGNTGSVNAADLEEKLSNEKKRWLVPGQYQNAWYELLGKKDPQAAEAFRKKLDQVRFEPVEAGRGVPSALAVLPAACGAGVGMAVCWFFISHSFWPVGAAAMLGGAVGGTFGGGFYRKKKEKAGDAVREQYIRQLKEMGRVLREIVSKADA